jgi:hypothetical protein
LDKNQVCALCESTLARESEYSYNNGGYSAFFFTQFPLMPTEAGHGLIAGWFKSKAKGIITKSGLNFYQELRNDRVFIRAYIAGASGRQESLRSRNGITGYHLLEEISAWE